MVTTKELAYDMEQAEISCLHSRLSAIKKIEGNPMGIDLKRFGHATCFSAAGIPGPSFNTVKGLEDSDEKLLDQIIEFYEQRGIPVRWELTPAHVSQQLLTTLSGKGYYQSGFHTSLYAPVSSLLTDKKEEGEVFVRRMNSDEFDIFASIYADSFQMPESLKPAIKVNNQVLEKDSNWMFYLATVDGEPVGIAVLYIEEAIAVLAAAATLPEFRRKGVHKAMIKKRAIAAKSRNCRLLVGQAGFGSASMRNMERAGMKIAFTKAIWSLRKQTL
ncbi:GNAT family N-acetyltransferase [Sediminibacillus dalangtanensis]|uniref:GNAT family N-acetyltransferase n=1 Tax=Sediminibacillus dalangtanensis TaxID=2729421 RepID=A0ABX7VZ87_9BACI|nr:GNAT family N-acetyltransferase [Sediminibacillus dalangtanensis]QTM99747.1 GNAT family N-acetyltransferase [Sediminibacillus dalangtanensis]